MSTTINEVDVQMFDSDVKLAYQQMGSKLRGLVRLKNTKGAISTTFNKLGKGSAGQKARHADVPIMNAVHSRVTATMADWYAADLIDNLDEYKNNIDERGILVQTAGGALGRKTDNLIITALSSGLATAQNITTTYAAALAADGGVGPISLGSAALIFKKFNDNDVPDDGGRVVVVNSNCWNGLLKIAAFSSADYVGAQFPLLQGTQARRWLNMWWMMHTGLATTGASSICIAFHKTAIGLGENFAIGTTLERVPLKDAILMNSKMSAGAVRIDDEGVIRFDVTT